MGIFVFPAPSGGGGGGDVDSVFGRTGNVVALSTDYAAFYAALSHAHSASDVTSGTFSTSLIPNLSATKITSDTLDVDRIPNLNASKITSGIFSVNRLGSGSPSSTTQLHGDGTWKEAAAGAWFSTVSSGTSISAQVLSPVANRVRVRLVNIPNRLTISRIAFNVGTAATASTAAFGLYTTAGDLIVHSGPLATTATGTVSTTVSPVTIQPGAYYICYASDVTTVAANGNATSTTVQHTLANTGTTVIFGFATNTYTTASGLPATLGALSTETNSSLPQVWFLPD